MGTLLKLAHVVKLPFVSLGRLYNNTAQRYPAATGVVTTVVKTSGADYFAQTVVEKRKEVDWSRHGMFCAFGLFYLGGFQYYLYNHLFVRWCGSITAAVGHRGAAPVKTFIDQAIHHPFFYFPVFYLVKGVVEKRPLESTLQRYREELWDNCKALWTIWIPAQLVNFAFVPRHLRIPFVAGVSFAWTVILSVMRGTLDSNSSASSTHALHAPVQAPGTAMTQASAVQPGFSNSSVAPVAHLRAQELVAQVQDQGLKTLVADLQT